MPFLKNLLCQVEWNTPKHTPFQEYSLTYGDGYAQCYIAIPLSPTSFAIRLKSNGYIAPGLAMFVFVDGQYQCNRNRSDLLVPAPGVDQRDCEVDFRVRQKELNYGDGLWTGKEWHFQKVTAAEEAPVNNEKQAARVGEHSGSIEVFVLRCFHPQFSKTHVLSPSSMRSGKSSARHSFVDDHDVPLMTGALFDGAGDTAPPASRRRLNTSPENGKPPRGSSIRFADGLRSLLDPDGDDVLQKQRKIREEILYCYDLGSDGSEPDNKRHLQNQSLPITTRQPVHAGRPEPDGTNNGDLQSITQLTARRSRGRRNSTARVSSADSWTWMSMANAEGNDQIPPQVGGFDGAPWENSAAIQSNPTGYSANMNGGPNHQARKWIPLNDQTSHHVGNWNGVGIPGANGGNHQMGQFMNSHMANGQSNTLNPGGIQGMPQPQNPQHMVFGLPSNPAPPMNLSGSKRMTPRPPSFTSAAPKRPFPGACSPPIGTGHHSAGKDSIKRAAAAYNAEMAKAAKEELKAQSSNFHQGQVKPMSSFYGGHFHTTPMPFPSMLANPALQNPQLYHPHILPGGQTVGAEAGAAEVPTREIRSSSPMEYSHRMSNPQYMDTMSDPYARFIFQYREDTIISDMIGIDIIEPKEDVYDRLAGLTKAGIINILLQEREDATKEEEGDKDTTKSSLQSSQNSGGYQPNLQAASQKLDQWQQNQDNDNQQNASNKNGGSTGRGSSTNKSTGRKGNGSAVNSNANSNKSKGGASQGNGEWGDASNGPAEKASWDHGNDQAQNNDGDASNGPPEKPAWDQARNDNGDDSGNNDQKRANDGTGNGDNGGDGGDGQNAAVTKMDW